MSSQVYIDWTGLPIILILSLVFGLVAFFFPMKIVKIFYRWPKFIYPKLFGSRNISLDKKQMWLLIEENPVQYKRRYWIQLTMIRLMGLVALLISAIGILGIIVYLRTP